MSELDIVPKNLGPFMHSAIYELHSQIHMPLWAPDQVFHSGFNHSLTDNEALDRTSGWERDSTVLVYVAHEIKMRVRVRVRVRVRI